MLLMLAALAVLMFLMMRRNKKTQQQQKEMQSKFGPGVDVMTSFGLFGTIRSIDEEENKVVLELSPGNLATVHRQAVTKVVEPPVPAEADADAEPALTETVEAPALKADSTPDVVVQDENGLSAEKLAAESPEETLKRLNGESK
ncbi:preprotein translocase subunit YajC [Arthrobacter sp. NPDC090010]|uniref:preprotein translocase subunit YajC n=1 Tax=Arthrobacter sp. NPDC090010 TaxID=3363942 RepID=UPI003809F82F